MIILYFMPKKNLVIEKTKKAHKGNKWVEVSRKKKALKFIRRRTYKPSVHFIGHFGRKSDFRLFSPIYGSPNRKFLTFT